MTTAREEAERRRKRNGSYLYKELVTFDMEVDAFVLGAKWQSGQPIEVTDEMVERGARALFEESQELDQDNSWDDALPEEWREEWKYQARNVLEAALQAPGVDVADSSKEH